MASKDRRHVAEDHASVVLSLRGARQQSGLTQAQFARALQTSASRMSTYLSGSTSPSAAFFLRALRLSRGLRVAAESHRMSPLDVTAAVHDAVAEGDLVWALKMVLQGRDDLRALLGEGSPGVDAWECDPGVLGVPAWDALLRAVAAHEFDVADREPPGWTCSDVGGGPWVFASPYFEPDEVRRRTPGWLAECGVYLVDRDLVTA